MRVWDQEGKKRRSLTEALALDWERHSVIAVVGGGGKTSLLFRLAEECREAGKTVALTTTTHMGKRSDFPMAAGGAKEEIFNLLQQEKVVLVGEQDQKGSEKISGVDLDTLKYLKKTADVVLVEADGAKRKPLKAPADWEPVIPADSDLVIAVAGRSGIGGRIENVCHRPGLAAALLEKSIKDRVTPEDAVKLAVSEAGLRKQVNTEFRVLVNQVDTNADEELARRMAALFQKAGVITAFSHLRDSLALILLAAGNSVRFGGNKLIYPVEGVPMYRAMLEKGLAVDADRRILVTQYEEVAETGKGMGYAVVRNPAPERGISSSIRLGVEAAGDAEAYLFGVCDQPYLRAWTLGRLTERYQLGPERIAAVRSGSRMGNPNIFSARYRQELLELEGDTGGKAVMRRHPEDVAFVEAGERELVDLDVRP